MDATPLPQVVVAATDPSAADRAAAVLLEGGTVVLPTDTVYGVAALPSVSGATATLFALKERSGTQPLAVLVADVDQALALVDEPGELVRWWMANLWPGPLTLVLSRSPSARSLALGGDEATIGVRCPDHGFVRALAARVGPIATTSANRHGQPSPDAAAAAAASLSAPVDLVVDGGRAGSTASTVVDATEARWVVLRQGTLRADRLDP